MATFPTEINNMILQNGYTRDETSRFISSEPASGTPFVQIESDDAVFIFNASVRLDQSQAFAFRSWMNAGNAAVMVGAEFDIVLWGESGFSTYKARFTDNGIPQLTGVNALTFNYSFQIMVRMLTGAPAVLLPGSTALN